MRRYASRTRRTGIPNDAETQTSSHAGDYARATTFEADRAK